jgi:hypothetical protein
VQRLGTAYQADTSGERASRCPMATVNVFAASRGVRRIGRAATDEQTAASSLAWRSKRRDDLGTFDPWERNALVR